MRAKKTKQNLKLKSLKGDSSSAATLMEAHVKGAGGNKGAVLSQSPLYVDPTMTEKRPKVSEFTLREVEPHTHRSAVPINDLIME